MTTPVIDQVAAVLEAASAAPWTAMPHHPLHDSPFVGGPGRLGLGTAFVATTASDEAGDGIRDARFIALARNLMPEALAVVRAAAVFMEDFRRWSHGEVDETGLDSGDDVDTALATFDKAAKEALGDV